MYKICLALVAMLAVAAAKPSLGYSYATPYSQAYSVAPVSPLAAVAPVAPLAAVAPVAPAISAYSQSIYSSPYVGSYAAPYVGSYAAPYAAALQYAAASTLPYAAAPLIAEPYSAYHSYAQSYASPLNYGYGELPLWKKK